MRAYHLMSQYWGIEALNRRRLKLSLLEDMNDPFELLAVDLANKRYRAQFRKLKTDLNRTIGVLCFSQNWSNPVLWSHYADRHRGLCLGFDIPDEWALKVNYRGSRLKEEFERKMLQDPDDEFADKLITTKFEHWEYEEEVRMIIKLENAEQDNEHNFIGFCDALKLREVIVGPRSKLTLKQLRNEIASEDKGVEIIKGRLAFTSFSVVCNKAIKNA